MLIFEFLSSFIYEDDTANHAATACISLLFVLELVDYLINFQVKGKPEIRPKTYLKHTGCKR